MTPQERPSSRGQDGTIQDQDASTQSQDTTPQGQDATTQGHDAISPSSLTPEERRKAEKILHRILETLAKDDRCEREEAARSLAEQSRRLALGDRDRRFLDAEITRFQEEEESRRRRDNEERFRWSFRNHVFGRVSEFEGVDWKD